MAGANSNVNRGSRPALRAKGVKKQGAGSARRAPAADVLGKLQEMGKRLARLEDVHAVRTLHFKYGYYSLNTNEGVHRSRAHSPHLITVLQQSPMQASPGT